MIWEINFPVAKEVMTALGPMTFSAIRFFSGAMFLFALLLARPVELWVPKGEVLKIVGLDLLGITIFQGLWTFGVHNTTAPRQPSWSRPPLFSVQSR